MKIDTSIKLRNFGLMLIIAGAVLSLVSGLFIERETALSILVGPLFLGLFLMLLAPYLSISEGCPNCKKRFWGKGINTDLLTTRCKCCGEAYNKFKNENVSEAETDVARTRRPF